MTVEVQTPQGLRSGAGVIKAEVRTISPVPGSDAHGSGGVQGQAVVVELPNGPLFVLLKPKEGGSDLMDAVTKALDPSAVIYPIEESINTANRIGAGSLTADLPRTDWPMMVRFRDIRDPKTVGEVDPGAVGVRRVRLETTRDAITLGIKRKLPWLSRKTKFSSQWQTYNGFIPADKVTAADTMSSRDFNTEINK